MLSIWEASNGLPHLYRVVLSHLIFRADRRGIVHTTVGELQNIGTIDSAPGRSIHGRPRAISIRRIIDWYADNGFIKPIGDNRYLIPALAKINVHQMCQQVIPGSQTESISNGDNGSPNGAVNVYRSDDRCKYYSEGVDINMGSTPDEIARLFETQFNFSTTTTRSPKVTDVFNQWSQLGASEELIIEVVNQVNINAKASNSIPGSPSYYHKAMLQRLEQTDATCEELNPIDDWQKEQSSGIR